jgi:glycosyltransferase involved in cell wall biosynthesis
MPARATASDPHLAHKESRVVQLSVVVPCYNEEEVLPETIKRLGQVLSGLVAKGKISGDSRVYFVDDGSKDATWKTIEESASTLDFVKGIKLSRNQGHQIALLAGLLSVPGDIVISVDADLQDDLGAMEKMVDAFNGGAQIVYGVRASRGADTFFKRFTAKNYYRMLAALGVELVFNHADYRLMSRRALEALAGYRETKIFLRGLIPQLVFKTAVVHYDRAERFAGESKYPLRKMLALAWHGVTSFSPAPLRFITGMGIFIATLSVGMSVWVLGTRLLTDRSVPGWASTVLPIYFLGGIQLLSLGVIGEYVANTYSEAKARPRYVIEKMV